MNAAPKSPCRSPGCSELVQVGSGGYCPAHRRGSAPAQRRTRAERYRGTAAERGYDWNWQVARLDFIGRYPVCRGILRPTALWSRELAEQFHDLRDRACEAGRIVAWPPECLTFLREEPIYEISDTDRGRPATVVDHIIPHKGDQVLFWAEWNWQGLTKRAHDIKTGGEARGQRSVPAVQPSAFSLQSFSP